MMDSSCSAFYVYEPLSSESSFRLLHLKNFDSSSDPMEVELSEDDFANPRPYAAVSYAWGGETPECPITCNGKPFLVTPTVLSVLQRLYSKDSDASIWIDSICIDQTSVAERNQQVPKMRLIYRQAQIVWVWLGEGSEETDVTFDFLHEVALIVSVDQPDNIEAMKPSADRLLNGAEPTLDSLNNTNLTVEAFDEVKHEFESFVGKCSSVQ